MSLESSPLVRFGAFLFLMSVRGAEQPSFRCAFRCAFGPFPRVGNFIIIAYGLITKSSPYATSSFSAFFGCLTATRSSLVQSQSK